MTTTVCCTVIYSNHPLLVGEWRSRWEVLAVEKPRGKDRPTKILECFQKRSTTAQCEEATKPLCAKTTMDEEGPQLRYEQEKLANRNAVYTATE